MEHKEFSELVIALCKQDSLPQVLELLKVSEDEEIAQAALSLAGQFALAEVEGEQRIYHVTIEDNPEGEDQEYIEHIMNEGDDVVRFVALFFEVMFDVKRKETYQAAGKTFQQPKR